jgi:hypothetical protein
MRRDTTRTRNGKTYDIWFTQIGDSGLIEYTVCEVKYPNRKIFRGYKALDSYNGVLDIDKYETMEKAIERMLDRKIAIDNINEERRRKLTEWVDK